MQVYNLCRICLIEDTSTKIMQPLFDEHSARCSEIVRQIEECGGIELKPCDKFPKVICSQCLEALNASHKFRSMCQASEFALIDMLIKCEPKHEPQDSGAINVLTVESATDIFFDMQTEFIDAQEVDLADITVHNDDHLTNNDDDDDDNDDEDDSYHDYVVSTSDSEYETSPEEETKRKIVTKKKKPIPTHKPAKRRGRPRLTTVSTYLERQSKTKKPSRGRKKLEEPQSNIMCEICGNIYSKRSLLKMHMRRHLAEKPFECEICSKTFACPSEISRHMRVHTGEKPYVCRFCSRTFADRSTHIKHERIHTNTRPFSCNTCGKSFTYSNVLKNHMLVHTGEKPFPCVTCNKTFSRKHQLDQHCSTLTHQQTLKSLSVNATVIKEGIEVLLQT